MFSRSITLTYKKRGFVCLVFCSIKIYLVETKKENDIPTEEVQSKAKAALEYCKNATDYTIQNCGKPWIYVLLPPDSVKLNMSFDYLMK